MSGYDATAVQAMIVRPDMDLAGTFGTAGALFPKHLVAENAGRGEYSIPALVNQFGKPS